jgi:hypothetical protein
MVGYPEVIHFIHQATRRGNPSADAATSNFW